MPASRALPEPGEPPTAGAWSPCRTPSRSEAKRTAEDGRIGDTARSGERHSMERRTTLADARRPPASARPSAGVSCARRARHPCCACASCSRGPNLWAKGRETRSAAPSLFEFTGVPPRARRPGSRRRHALEDPPEAAPIADAAFAEAPSPLENAKGGEIREARQARKGRNWHSGYQAPVGVDAGSGPVHGRGRRQRQRRRHRLRSKKRQDGPFCHAGSMHGHGRLALGCQRGLPA